MNAKITAQQLQRRAYVYVRQSTAMQVFQHRESTQRQYALADRAAALGWPADAIEVIDEDLGRSGATKDGRAGFARLVESVAHGEVGAVFAIEVSRLARSSEDWQRLLALCAVAEVAVIDEQAIYDPSDKDDKLLLDIKGTMSEAELHWIALRLNGALRSKARRGELRITPPAGYVWGGNGLELDPDQAVRSAMALVFERYSIESSVWKVLRWARQNAIKIPTRRGYADGTGDVIWRVAAHSRLHYIFRNPVYAGVYVYGRAPRKKILVDGKICVRRTSGLDPEQWAVKIQNAHPGYITWEQYVKNQQKLRDNRARFDRATRGAPREGGALLTGLLLCGRCGCRMATFYGSTHRTRAYYECRGQQDSAQRKCWAVPADVLDDAVEKLFLGTMVPSELDLSLAVERETGAQAESLGRQWKLRIEQAEYEARRAERRYKAVDPENRVVARTLESDWEQRLQELQELHRQYDAARQQHHVELSEQDRRRIRALAHDLPKVWKSATTSQSDRKAMLRIVIEAISLSPVDVPRRVTTVRVGWKSGAVSEIEVPRPSRRDQLAAPTAALNRLRELVTAGMRDEQVAEQLNAEGFKTGKTFPWNLNSVRWARRRHGIARTAPDAPRTRPLPDRHEDGRYSVSGAARRFDVSTQVVRGWIERGLVAAERQPHPQHPRRQVLWLVLDDTTTERLERLSRSIRNR
jgi:DNA invertase Pin-like site-specific DNA recombinase